jgi:hypothetical protein
MKRSQDLSDCCYKLLVSHEVKRLSKFNHFSIYGSRIENRKASDHNSYISLSGDAKNAYQCLLHRPENALMVPAQAHQ